MEQPDASPTLGSPHRTGGGQEDVPVDPAILGSATWSPKRPPSEDKDQGRKLGASAQAALTTRSFTELSRLGRACGARAETLVGLSGLGDLILTCSSPQSRNFALGIALGRGEPPPSGKLAEGQFTAPVLVELAASQGVDMPVSNAVAAILSGKVTIDAAIEGLLTRPFKAEE